MGRRARWLICFLVLVPIAILALLDSLSRAYEASDPDVAVALNPINTTARIRRSVSALNAAEPARSMEAVVADLQAVRELAPVDARTYGLLGETELRGGDDAAARQFFSRALGISPVELHSLKRSIGFDLSEGDLGAALPKLQTLLRRWPGRFAEFADIFPAAMSEDAGYDLVLSATVESEELRRRVLDYLAGRPETALLGYRLLIDLRRGDPPLSDAETDRAISRLFSRGRPQLAHRAFALTRSGGAVGYVTNAAFSAKSASTPFDWRLPRLAGVEARILAGGSGPGGGDGLQVRFRGKPVKGVIAEQTLMLPPGAGLTLSSVSTARTLKLPKGLSWTITCDGARTPLARMELDGGRYEDRVHSVDFTIPASGCTSQRLSLATELVAQSMRYRYDGTLFVQKIEVTQNGV